MEITKPSLIADPESDVAFLKDRVGQSEEPTIKKLSAHIHKVWTQNQKDFKPVRKEMVDTLRRVKGQYDPQKLANIKAFQGSEIYLRTGENKCRAAESWIKDIYRGDTNLPWSIEPTTIPELPDETVQEIQMETKMEAENIKQQLMQGEIEVSEDDLVELINEYYYDRLDRAKKELHKDAKKRCKRASDIIKDQNEEGRWNIAFKNFLWNFIRLKYGVIKGPVLTKQKKQSWESTEVGFELVVKEELVTSVYAPSPFNIFPEKDMTDSNDGDIIEIHELTRQALTDLIGVPGYSDEELRIVISKLDSNKIKREWFTIDDLTAVRQATKGTTLDAQTKPATTFANDPKNSGVLAQEFYGTVSGKMLIEWGIDSEIDEHAQYQANCWKIDQHVIKAVINPDSLGRKPYQFSSWAKNPESLIGEGLLEFAGPVEDAMNAVMRALVNNVAIASGPMAEIDKDRVDMAIPIYPWRQIESTSLKMNGNTPAVNYYQPQMHSQELTSVWQFLSKVLDEMTVPAYAQGASQAGVTSGTATVFTQLLAAASRSIKAVVANIDDDIITPYIQMCYDNNMKFHDDESSKGDATIVAKGVTALLEKEQQAQRKVEYLQIIANPAFMEILGRENIASILAQIAKSNDIDLPNMEQLEPDNDAEAALTQMLMAQAGVDPMQENGQIGSGGGAPAKSQGMNPDGSKAGVNNG